VRTASLACLLLAVAALVAPAGPLAAQIQRNPTGVNVNATGPTTVFISFGNLDGYVPVEAIWCGELVSAAPALGEQCDPATIFGALPIRFDRSQFSGQNGFSDIMSIPASVARRARQAAVDGAESSFFYVRRFVDPTGGRPDQYVSVTCRLAGSGARTPLALMDVELRFAGGDAVPGVAPGGSPPPLTARIAYNGTGRLVGRWEVVLPGEDPPTGSDLLTEATLPAERRGTQRRFTELERFNLFLPPTGEIILPGPPPERLPTALNGLYQVLLRIEASDDKEGDMDLAAAGAGEGIVPTGAVAGFALPVLRYFVGTRGPTGQAGTRLRLLEPGPEAVVSSHRPTAFSWSPIPAAALYRLEVRGTDGRPVVGAVLQAGTASYAAPPFLLAERAGQVIEWRVLALNAEGAVIETTPWQRLEVEG
jgi:hypothetical protein